MIIAVTGHRPNKLGGYREDAFRTLVALATNMFQAQKPSRVITGMALGWDQAVAQACIDCGIPFTAAVPFSGQEQRWPAASQERYRTLLAAADNIVVVSEGNYAAWKMQKRNEWMIDQADLVIACWDGSAGGTANAVNYARRKGVRIENILNPSPGLLGTSPDYRPQGHTAVKARRGIGGQG